MRFSAKTIALAASLWAAVLAPSAAFATIYDQGAVTVTGGPTVVDLIGLDGYAPFPVDTTVYLTVRGGVIQNADWNVSFNYQKLWWETWGDQRVLWGNEYFGGLSINENDSGAFDQLLTYDATLASPPWASFDKLRISTLGTNFCDQPGLPDYVDCAFTLLDSRSDYVHFAVAADRDFTWTISDVAPAPEPSTWALMTVGMGGLGALLRRRRAAAGHRALAC